MIDKIDLELARRDAHRQYLGISLDEREKRTEQDLFELNNTPLGGDKMTLKQAILALPKISKKWLVSNSNTDFIVNEKLGLGLGVADYDCNTIDELHAAAKSIGIEIWWEPKYGWVDDKLVEGYVGRATIETKEDYIQINVKDNLFKRPSLVIQAAFIAAVEYRLKEGK